MNTRWSAGRKNQSLSILNSLKVCQQGIGARLRLLAAGVLLQAAFVQHVDAQGLTKYVDPFIGTGGHGHTYPGATVPFGMVQLSPDNGTQGWDWCSGYYYADTAIAGFSHMHLTGTGIGDWADVSVMPNTGLIPAASGMFRVGYSHKNEAASPGYYRVTLNNGINAELTAAEHTGFHRYTFPKGSTPTIAIDLGFHINWDKPTDTYLEQINDSTVVGYRYSTGWAKVQRVYFAARTSKPIRAISFNQGAGGNAARSAKGQLVKGQMQFDDLKGMPVLLKVALSTVSTAKAEAALGEIQGWDFSRVKEQASAKWEKELEKIQVKTADERLKRIFYTAFYHTCLAPVTYSDVDGEYQNAKGQVLKGKGQRYTEYSLWDTFRALNPLFTITQPGRYPDILNSMLAFYDENGLLPVWDLSSAETNTMTGYHAIPVLADAILKDIKGLNAEKAYEAMKKSAMQDIRGTNFYRQYGYVPQDKYGSSVTVTVEYAYDDWCIAQVAKKLGKKDDYAVFMKRAASWKNLFDPKTGFIRAKNSDGKWVVPFDPYYSEHDPDKAMYTEGNAWQHSFFVPQDVQGLAKAHGGDKQFIRKLDSLFMVSSEMTGANKSPDVSGMIGQYAHGNEPSHHIAYLYNFVGAPWKTQEKVHMILDSMYHDRPDGYAGNEDCGQMSAWAVWSLCGLYPANAASGQYIFGSPMLEEVRIAVPNGKNMTIRARNAGRDNFYIQEVRLNGKPYLKNYIDHKVLLQGGELEFVMGAKPNTRRGTSASSRPGI